MFDDFSGSVTKGDYTESIISMQEDQTPHCSIYSLKRLCPPFQELFSGIRVLISRIPSDYTDAFTKDNVGTMLSSILFIYFVVFAPAITFGTLMCKQLEVIFTFPVE